MRMILLVAALAVVGCSKSQPVVIDPNEGTVVTADGTTAVETADAWPVIFRNGHIVVSVYPPVASKVKLEAEDTAGKWHPLDSESTFAKETMLVVPYRVANTSASDAFQIDDTITVVCKLADWRDYMRRVSSMDYHIPEFDTGSQLRVVAPADGHSGGLVQNRPYELAAGQSVAAVAAFRPVDIALLVEGDASRLAVACFVSSDATGIVAGAFIDIPADFVVPK